MTKYLSIYDDIKSKIINSDYAPWAPLQGEVILAQKYNVSRTTIRKAIEKLKSDGFVHSRQGSGIFVNSPDFYEEAIIHSLSEKYSSSGRLRSKVSIFKKIFADEELASTFNTPVDSIFYFFRRVRFLDGKAICIEETYMPKSLFQNLTGEHLEGSLLDYIEKECGLVISHDSKEIKAIALNQEEAVELNVDEGYVTIEVSHKLYLTKSTLAQYTREIQLNNSLKIASVR